MAAPPAHSETPCFGAPAGRRIAVSGIVQGVGFRPKVLMLARSLGVVGSVRNEGTAAVIEAFGTPAALQTFEQGLQTLHGGNLRVDAVNGHDTRTPDCPPTTFEITTSADAQPGLGVAPDAATCPACVAEVLDPGSRRFRYPLNACAECGPRLSVFQRAPYDRAHTTMAPFPLCAACEQEYANTQDRRFHAQAMACHVCGPKVRLVRLDGQPLTHEALGKHDAMDAAGTLLDQGEILLIKGLGGYQLACDATHPDAVKRLRALKQRETKPFALMARDLPMLRQWCEVDAVAEVALLSPAAPIVLLPRCSSKAGHTLELASGIAPGLNQLGAMLPPSALHHLLMRGRQAPLVLTSGNVSGEPQAITLQEARGHTGTQVAYALDHERAIQRRVDDSVGRVIAGAFRVMRRARGFAPAPLPIPPGFGTHPRVLALGSDLKNTFALLRDGQGVLSQHIGDLHDATCLADQQKALADYLNFYDFQPDVVAFDAHPGYAAHHLAPEPFTGPRLAVGHHHAHIAACLGEHGWPLDGGKVLGIALDGLGLGDDGQLWGGEFLLTDYTSSQRVGTLQPMALLGGDLAAREPWRNTYAQLMAAMGWDTFAARFHDLELFQWLQARPRALLEQMLHKPKLAPCASSTGRLFDAVAAALDLCRARTAYEGEAAMRLEALVTPQALASAETTAYPFDIEPLEGHTPLPCIEPRPMWLALLTDLQQHTPAADIAARFHLGFARAVVRMAAQQAQAHGITTVALGGGVFQNRVLTECICQGLAQAGLQVLLPREVPANDGGLAWGQALIALARHPATPH